MLISTAVATSKMNGVDGPVAASVTPAPSCGVVVVLLLALLLVLLPVFAMQVKFIGLQAPSGRQVRLETDASKPLSHAAAHVLPNLMPWQPLPFWTVRSKHLHSLHVLGQKSLTLSPLISVKAWVILSVRVRA